MVQYRVTYIILVGILYSGVAFVPSRRSSSHPTTRVDFPSALRLEASAAKLAEPTGGAVTTSFGRLFAPLTAVSSRTILGGVAIVVAFMAWFQKIVWTASRTYDREANSVGREYDAWTEEGILEYYWGEHIHLGYYNSMIS